MTLIELAIQQAKLEKARLKYRGWTHPEGRDYVRQRVAELEDRIRVWMEMQAAENPPPKKQKKEETLPRKKLRVNGYEGGRGYSWQGGPGRERD